MVSLLAAVSFLFQTPTIPPVQASVPITSEAQLDWTKKDHSVEIAGQPVKYQTVAGKMPIRAKNGDIEGRIFFVSYKRTDLPANSRRPVTFVFNGGPGSASVWLHLGLVGPKRPKMGSPEGVMPSPRMKYRWIVL